MVHLLRTWLEFPFLIRSLALVHFLELGTGHLRYLLDVTHSPQALRSVSRWYRHTSIDLHERRTAKLPGQTVDGYATFVFRVIALEQLSGREHGIGKQPPIHLSNRVRTFLQPRYPSRYVRTA